MALSLGSKCLFTPCKLHFFERFCLVSYSPETFFNRHTGCWGAITGNIIGSIYAGYQSQTQSLPLISGILRFTEDTVVSIALADTTSNAISIGGDSDKIACMAGGIAGACNGEVPGVISRTIMGKLDDYLRRIVKSFFRRYLRGQAKMKVVFIFLILTAVAIVIGLFVLGRSSASGDAPGLVDGKLASCPQTPNCVCSEFRDDVSHYLEPIAMSDGQGFSSIINALENIGGEVVVQSGNYLAARFSSRLFGFVDDVEFRLDTVQGVIQFRSASRVGHSDFGVNRKRIERLKKQLYE